MNNLQRQINENKNNEINTVENIIINSSENIQDRIKEEMNENQSEKELNNISENQKNSNNYISPFMPINNSKDSNSPMSLPQLQFELKDKIIDNFIEKERKYNEEIIKLKNENEMLKTNLAFVLKRLLINQRKIPNTLKNYESKKHSQGFNNSLLLSETNYYTTLEHIDEYYKDNPNFESRLSNYINTLIQKSPPSYTTGLLQQDDFSLFVKDLNKQIYDKSKNNSIYCYSKDKYSKYNYTLTDNPSQNKTQSMPISPKKPDNIFQKYFNTLNNSNSLNSCTNKYNVKTFNKKIDIIKRGMYTDRNKDKFVQFSSRYNNNKKINKK